MAEHYFGGNLKPYKFVCNRCGFKKIIYPQGCCKSGDELMYRNCPHCKVPTERKKLGFLEEIFISFQNDYPKPHCKSWKNLNKS